METLSLIISVVALCLGVFNLLQNLGIIYVKNKVDKYDKYRNAEGLYGGKKRE
jgi:hypothetical protein